MSPTVLTDVKAAGVAIAILVFCACDSSPTGNHSATPTPAGSVIPSAATSPSAVASSPVPRPNLLVALLQSTTLETAVLEGRIPSQDESRPDKVVIAGLDGQVRASAMFTPMPIPKLGCLMTDLPPSAHVVGGRVYFADGHGTIRSLGSDGSAANVANLPLTSTQQMLSFAVSPDATRILATIFTTPLDAFTCTGPAGDTGRYTFDVYSGPVGGPVQRISHNSWIGHSNHPVMSLTGWDAVGPIGRFPSIWASQPGDTSSIVGVFARIDPMTLEATPLGDTSSCFVWDSNAAGSFVCRTSATLSADSGSFNTAFSVKKPDGSTDWTFTISNPHKAESPVLAPDAQHVAVFGQINGLSYFLVARDGTQSLLPAGFFPTGWVDADTIFGTSPGPNVRLPETTSFVSLDAPHSVVALDLDGLYVGPIEA